MHEVTIEPADNGFIVRTYREGKDGPGRSIKRVAANPNAAMRHAKELIGDGHEKKRRDEKPRKESEETPRFEARNHSPKFLRKAAKMAKGRKGKHRSERR